MRIDKTENLHFNAKWYINNKKLLRGTKISGQSSSLDCMLDEGPLVRFLNNTAVYIRQHITSKYFDSPKTFLEKGALKLQDKTVFYSRKIAAKIMLKNHNNDINELNNSFVYMTEDSPEYIEELAKIGKNTPEKFININSEDKILEKISKSDKPTIFLLNHPNYQKDKFIYVILNSILSQMYTVQGKQASCPRPEIVVSRDMLKILGEKIGNIYKKLGLIPIDASLGHKDKEYNAKSMKKLFNDFSNGKTNIFFFPEGNNSKYIEKPLSEKIQPGIVSFANQVLSVKNKLRIVPVGIYYTNEKNSMGNVHIGKPLYLKKRNNTLVYTTGNTDLPQILRTDVEHSFPKLYELIKKSMEIELINAKNMQK